MPAKIKTTEQFILDAKKVHGDKYDYSKTKYVRSNIKVIITCPAHGDFEQTPNNHLKGTQCPICGNIQRTNSNRQTTEYFINRARQVHENKYDYSKVEYINTHSKVAIICHSTNEFGEEHGIFWQRPHDHIDGKCGCPKCKNKGQHRLYDQLCSIFPNEEIRYEVNDKLVPWLEGQRFDIYFSKYNIAVEYNGPQHYMPIEQFGGQEGFENTQARDKLKRLKCQKNDCTLIEIRYKYSQQQFKQLIDNINNVINQKELCNQEKM